VSEDIARHRRRLLAAVAVLFPLLAACSALPVISPEFMHPSGDPTKVQMQGARGALTQAQSSAVLDRLKLPGTATEIKCCF
jgi:cardiolipin synthase A/B